MDVPKFAPVNPDVLAWAMDDSGFGVEQLAEKTKVPADRIRSFLAGKSEPQTKDFSALASALHRPLAFFFLPEPPERSGFPISFRNSSPSVKSELGPDEIDAIRDARRWQSIVAWIRDRSEQVAPIGLEGSETEDSQGAAKKVVDWLDWKLIEQRRATSPSAVFRLLRDRLEARGVLVLQFSSLRKDSCRGFFLPHPHTPVIAINTKYNPAARVFTVFHELMHLLRGDEAVCGSPTASNVERWCERTAALCLVPAGDLEEYLDKYLTTGTVTSLDECRKVANRYKISLRAAAVRLISVGRASQSFYAKVDRETDFEGGGPNPNVEPQTTPVIKIRTLGNEIPRELIGAANDGILSEVQVRRYLGVNPDQMRAISERVTVSDQGA